MTPTRSVAFRARLALTLLACASLGACAAADAVGDVFDDDEPERAANAPEESRRIPVLTRDQVLAVDEAAAEMSDLPPAYVNEAWPQTGGTAAHAMQHPDAGGTNRAWSRSIGSGDSRNSRVTAQPVVDGGRIFTMDGDGVVAAFNAQSGNQIWRRELRVENERDNYGFGGGVAVGEGRVYASSGVGLMSALDPADGSVIWSVETAIPMHSAPTVANGRVFAVTDDNVLLALDAATGERLWSFQGIAEPARMMTSPAPAVEGDIVVAPFGSGELVALNAASGQPLWQDTLTRASGLAPIATLNDVAGSPVIYEGVVYAMSHSGVLAAIDLDTGERVWTLPAGGANMPWLAGESLFIMTAEAQLGSVDRMTGQVRWLKQLPSFENEERRRGKISWVGPVLAGGRLAVVSSEGDGMLFDPFTGSSMGDFEASKAYVPPLVANRTLYVLDSEGTLTAYR